MTTGRGREARIRPQYRELYQQLDARDWKPVEAILDGFAALPVELRASARNDPGSRLLPDEHFEFRGSSSRPEGFPPRLSRVTDCEGESARAAALEEKLEAEQDLLSERQREADQTIRRAEQLQEREELLHQEFEQLRRRAAKLDLHPEQEPQTEPGGQAPE